MIPPEATRLALQLWFMPVALLTLWLSWSATAEPVEYDLGPDNDAANLLVVRVKFNVDGEKDRITVWRNPERLGADAPEPDLTEAKHDVGLDRLGLANFTNDGRCGPVEFATLRFGQTYASVTGAGEDAGAVSRETFRRGYRRDRPLSGTDVATVGYDGPWRRHSGENERVAAGSMSFKGLEPGGRLAVLGHRTRIVRNLDTSESGPFANYVDDEGVIARSEDGRPLYFSVLMRHASARKTDSAIVEWRRGGDHGAEHMPLAIGVRGGQGQYRVRIGAEPAENARITDAPPREDAVLWRTLPVPDPLLTQGTWRTKPDIRFGGDVRIGDLNGDDRCDFVVYRCVDGASKGAHVGGVKPAFIGAFEMDGSLLWKVGENGHQPSRPQSVAVYDFTGDGADDIICLWHDPGADGKAAEQADWRSLADVVVQIRDGRSGDVVRKGRPAAVTERRMKDSVGANWIHQRILIANVRGTDEPRDFVIKLGDTYVAMNESLEVLWTYRSPWYEYGDHPAYIPAVGDMDADGRDELAGGYAVIDDDGTPLWEKKLARHMDSVRVAAWDNGKIRMIGSGGGHVVGVDGEIIMKLGEKVVPHGQEVRVADFHGGYQGNEAVFRVGHKTGLQLASSETNELIGSIQLNKAPAANVGMTPVYWNGPDQQALLYNSGWLWNLETEEGRPLPDLPAARGNDVHRMSWYHCITGNLAGDGRQEIVLWDPAARHIYIYTPAPFDASAYDGYTHGPRQYNPRLMD